MGDVPKEKRPSAVETAKGASRQLRGNLAETLAGDATHFAKDDQQVLKFHGVYQQDDRDTRLDRKKAGNEPDYMFMVRVAIPGGVLTADQYLGLDAVADDCANRTLRITTRQGIQFHGVVKTNLKPAIAEINRRLLTTLAACGDVARNTMACPAPLKDSGRLFIRDLAGRIARELRPQTRAYHEIWINGEKVETASPQDESFYKAHYLPRKFKVGVALADDNCIDVYAQDCGLVAVVEDGRIGGLNLLVGGGMGMTHNRPDTVARLGEPLGSIEPDHAVEAVRTVAAIFRDHGNRSDRRHARLKYLLAEWGIDRFREEFRRRADFTLHDAMTLPTPVFHDHLGRHEQGDGRYFFGVHVPNGRIADREGQRLKSALREIVRTYHADVHMTPQQNLLLANLTSQAVDDVPRTLERNGVTLPARLSPAVRYGLACPALPTCGLAITESERVMPEILARFEAALSEIGAGDRPISIRMTGCPNGCSRPYNADIGLVGRKPGSYSIYVGGGLPGNRAVDLYCEDIPPDDLIPTLRPLFESWAANATNGESLSDYYQRVLNRREPRQQLTGSEQPTRQSFELKVIP